MKIILANSNPIHKELEHCMVDKYQSTVINKKEDLTEDNLRRIDPDYIFFPHWSSMIPKNVHENFNCILFHMTDLPYGRGGSPLQNLIVRGHEKTVVTAIKVSEGLDTGDIYLKKELSLLGTAEEIFLRLGAIIFDMINEIIEQQIKPKPQLGEATIFKRRKPHQGNIELTDSLHGLYDMIRMLDAEGYPRAFLETEHFMLEFSRASLKKDMIISDVRIIKK